MAFGRPQGEEVKSHVDTKGVKNFDFFMDVINGLPLTCLLHFFDSGKQYTPAVWNPTYWY